MFGHNSRTTHSAQLPLPPKHWYNLEIDFYGLLPNGIEIMVVFNEYSRRVLAKNWYYQVLFKSKCSIKSSYMKTKTFIRHYVNNRHA